MDMSVRILALAVAAALVVAGCGGGGGDSGDGRDTSPGGASALPEGLPFSPSGWKTDFTEHSVPLEEFTSGGPGKDGIPAIDHPRFTSVAYANRFYNDAEAIAVLELGGEVKAYPIAILVWHEIVNDELAGQPVALTYCPLCNSMVGFSREVGGRVLDFGTTGNLRNSDLVMYDRQTESWWQQITADAVVGKLTGTKLHLLSTQTLSWGQVKRLYPDAKVLSRRTGYSRPYGENPYLGYEDNPNDEPFLFEGRLDRSLPPVERVARSGPACARPLSTRSRACARRHRSTTACPSERSSAAARSSSSSSRTWHPHSTPRLPRRVARWARPPSSIVASTGARSTSAGVRNRQRSATHRRTRAGT
jgi:Protein of unknown function (DUF3179)